LYIVSVSTIWTRFWHGKDDLVRI